MIVTLTEELIASAIPKNCQACVIANALRPHFPGRWISVAPGDKFGTVTIEEDDGKQSVYQLTKKANRVGMDFDEGIIVEPQELQVWE